MIITSCSNDDTQDEIIIYKENLKRWVSEKYTNYDYGTLSYLSTPRLLSYRSEYYIKDGKISNYKLEYFNPNQITEVFFYYENDKISYTEAYENGIVKYKETLIYDSSDNLKEYISEDLSALAMKYSKKEYNYSNNNLDVEILVYKSEDGINYNLDQQSPVRIKKFDENDNLIYFKDNDIITYLEYDSNNNVISLQDCDISYSVIENPFYELELNKMGKKNHWLLPNSINIGLLNVFSPNLISEVGNCGITTSFENIFSSNNVLIKNKYLINYIESLKTEIRNELFYE